MARRLAAGARAAVVGALLGALAGCGGFAQPKPGEPSAELVLRSNRASNPFGSANAVQRYKAISSPVCEESQDLGELAGFNLLANGDEKVVRVAPGARLMLSVQSIGSDAVNPRTKMQHHCINLVSFVPEQGQRYRIEQALERPGVPGYGAVGPLRCRAEVIDLATAAPPPTLERHQLSGYCRIR